MSFSATAFICLYNEADIIGYVAKRLIEQGIGVYIIDNWSTDGSAEIVRELPLMGYEKFPVDAPSPHYSWRLLLGRVEQLAFVSQATWSVHHDADEIRYGSQKGESLLDGLARVDKAGFNAVNFQVYHFLPTDDLYDGQNPETHFRYYTVDHGDCRMRQVKAWRNTAHRVDLAGTGGHYASFPGIRVAPDKFILKHYPLRSAAQAERKVLRERVGRYDPAELALNWHVQYNSLAQSREWIRKTGDLRLWSD